MATILFPVGQNDITFLKDQWDELFSPYTSDTVVKNSTFDLLKD